ncbi:MAG: Uma2 family endonuclease [Tepidisphaeraceae bacterium]
MPDPVGGRGPTRRKFTKREYHEMTERGFFQGQRVELIAGEVIEMAPQKDEHSHAVRLGDYALKKAFGDACTVSVQLPFDVDADSQPEPDLLVAVGGVRTITAHPKSAVLIVEVSDTTLEYDRTIKASLYASRRVEDYWVVNLIERVLEVYRKPTPDPAATFGWSYASRLVHRPDETIAPLALPAIALGVRELLP